MLNLVQDATLNLVQDAMLSTSTGVVGVRKVQNIEDSSFFILGYQLLPLAMGDNREFDNSTIF